MRGGSLEKFIPSNVMRFRGMAPQRVLAVPGLSNIERRQYGRIHCLLRKEFGLKENDSLPRKIALKIMTLLRYESPPAPPPREEERND